LEKPITTSVLRKGLLHFLQGRAGKRKERGGGKEMPKARKKQEGRKRGEEEEFPKREFALPQISLVGSIDCLEFELRWV
jgi:hypothetical protein